MNQPQHLQPGKVQSQFEVNQSLRVQQPQIQPQIPQPQIPHPPPIQIQPQIQPQLIQPQQQVLIRQ